MRYAVVLEPVTNLARIAHELHVIIDQLVAPHLLRQRLKRLPGLVSVKNRLWEPTDSALYAHDVRTINSPGANIAILAFALPRIKAGGWIIVEDILKSALPVWQVVAALLPGQEYKTHLIAANDALVFAVKKIAQPIAT